MARYADEAIRVRGFAELRKGLKEADRRFPRELAQANKRIAGAIVVPDAKRRAARLTKPPTGHAIIDSIKAGGSQDRVKVEMGAQRGAGIIPYLYGMEFGSESYPQFAPRSPRVGRGNQGYFFYPAIRAAIPAIRDVYGEMLDDLLERAFPGA